MPRKEARKRKTAGLDESREIETNIQKNWLFNFKIKKPFNFNPKHQQFYNSIIHDDTNMSFVAGPAGSAKSYIAVLAGLELLKERKITNIIYIRSVIESASRSIGALPGEIDDKFSPYAMPLIEKITEITDPGTCNFLKSNNIIQAVPVNFVRGLTFNEALVIVDEAQNLSKSEIVTILTRFGKGTKYVICGDLAQSDIGKQSGFKEIYDRFSTDECTYNKIFSYKFEETEIVRSKILKFIVKILEAK
jgi:phosphate starvation-inducible PhoH-like protein